ncbi:phage integrase [Mycobacteroides stephanolepidis]|uniref:Phage integrase n=1 Tax=[Mycobacterium] stephanolepidis TaxID=1520670 RepID=A0A1Z4EVT6_9MYCO|nr:hypothetical protein [[Mycobacterium] stephanolepidis]BAX97062.1 phage integrase [[Mycobacterium] stephanolepidis]
MEQVSSRRRKSRPKGAQALPADQLGKLLDKLQANEYCQELDLVDPFTLFIATEVRRSELLAWAVARFR